MGLDIPYELEGLGHDRKRIRRTPSRPPSAPYEELTNGNSTPNDARRLDHTRRRSAAGLESPGARGTTKQLKQERPSSAAKAARQISARGRKQYRGIWPPFPSESSSEITAGTDEFSTAPVVVIAESLPDDWDESIPSGADGTVDEREIKSATREATELILARRWETAWINWFLYIFAGFFHFQRFQITELEKELADADSLTIYGLYVKILQVHLGRKDVVLSNWEDHAEEYFRNEGASFNPFLTGQRYTDFNVVERVLALYWLCNNVMEQNDSLRLYINAEMNPDAMRIDVFGEDDHKNKYYFFEDTRLYCESNDQHWAPVCRTAQDWQDMAKRYEKSRSKAERELHAELTSERVEKIIEKLLAKERELERQRLYELAPKKRSSRIEVMEAKKKIEEREAVMRQETEKLEEFERQKKRAEEERRRKAEHTKAARAERERHEKEEKELDSLEEEENRQKRIADRQRRAGNLEREKTTKARLAVRTKAQRKRTDHERLMRSLGRESGLSIEGFRRQYVFDSSLANAAAKAIDSEVCDNMIEYLFIQAGEEDK